MVKATLKLSLEMKRKNSCGGDSSETDTTKMAKLEECDSSDGDDDVDTDSKSMKCGVSRVTKHILIPYFIFHSIPKLTLAHFN